MKYFILLKHSNLKDLTHTNNSSSLNIRKENEYEVPYMQQATRANSSAARQAW